jgi:hypothetical protein
MSAITRTVYRERERIHLGTADDGRYRLKGEKCHWSRTFRAKESKSDAATAEVSGATILYSPGEPPRVLVNQALNGNWK